MEKPDRSGQEEFIWAMRTRSLYYDTEELWDLPEASVSTDFSVGSCKRASVDVTTNKIDDDHNKLLCSLLPDFVIYDPDNFKPQKGEACLLYGTIDGYDELYELYNSKTKGGPSHLSQILNQYIGSMIQDIMTFNGDILNITGNKIIAVWKAGQEMSMQDCVQTAIDCGLAIQKVHPVFQTEIGVKLKVKILIHAGHVTFALVGNQNSADYVVVGNPLIESEYDEFRVRNGEVYVSHSAWCFADVAEYTYGVFDVGGVKVDGFTSQWRSRQKSIQNSQTSFNAEDKDIYQLRPSMRHAVSSNIQSKLYKFIIVPIVKTMKMNEGIEFLTEMRQVVTLIVRVSINADSDEQLIEIINQCYTLIFEILDPIGGNILKLNYFGFDLVVTALFGLRGNKHDLDSQKTLMGAMTCYKWVRPLRGVIATSVAVTSGNAYVGILGHSLRREYSVISMPFLKANKLVNVYFNKVVCDRDTFLFSKLDPTHFLIQYHKSIDGIINVGAVYEYVDIDSRQSACTKPIHIYPILDREAEMNLYINILVDHLDGNKDEQENESDVTEKTSTDTKSEPEIVLPERKYTCIVYVGEARIGKTRLTEEILFMTPKEKPIFRIEVNRSEKKVPYHGAEVLFYIPMGLSDFSSIEERSAKLFAKMKDVTTPEFICSLNPVFRVNFPLNKKYTSLPYAEKVYAQKKMIEYLCRRCFYRKWIIVIDDADNIDESSWPLIEVMMDSQLLLFILTISKVRSPSYIVDTIMDKPTCIVYYLAPINKNLFAALACQLMNVQALPPELEKVLHAKSSGNPGWIENFLINLIQSHDLNIVRVMIHEIQKYGLIVPPPFLISRDEKKDSQENLIPCTSQEIISLFDKWAIYKDIFRSSTMKFGSFFSKMAAVTPTLKSALGRERQPSVTSKRKSILLFRSNDSLSVDRMEVVDVCLLAPGGDISDTEPELAVDVIIIKIFDALTSYEQLLLKCSAVIGESFSRDMLFYVMDVQKQMRKATKAIQKLFEIHVLACAQGDFTIDDNAILQPPTVDTSKDHLIYCKCVGLRVFEGTIDLPSYANCGYMRFKIQHFRDITYKLLTETQKKLFHRRAIKYLESHTKRCRKCGSGYFVRVMGVRYDEETIKMKKNHVEFSIAAKSSTSLIEKWDFVQERQSKFKMSSTHSSVSKSKASKYSSMGLRQSLKDRDLDSVDTMNGSIYVYKMVKKEKDKLVRTFSRYSFVDCECSTILSGMYRQILAHTDAAEDWSKWLIAVMEYSILCIEIYNISYAIEILESAILRIEDNSLYFVKRQELWKAPYLKGKLYALIGKAKFEVGHHREALASLELALDFYGYTFPSQFSFKMKLIQFKNFLSIHSISHYATGKKYGYNAEFADNISDCLATMCTVFLAMGDTSKAEIAAKWSLRKALESNKDFVTLMTAFGNMLNVCIISRKVGDLLPLEIKALVYCKRYKAFVESRDLKAVFWVYSNIFIARLLRAELEYAMNIGSHILKIANSLITSAMLEIIPLYMQVMILGNKLLETVNLILDFEYACLNFVDTNGETWFYALCITFHLETGYIILPFKQCENLYYLKRKNSERGIVTPSVKRYYTVIWLWYLRAEMEEEAAMWEPKAYESFSLVANDEIVNIYTALYYLEATITSVCCQIDRKNLTRVYEIFETIDDTIQQLEPNVQKVLITAPRFLIMKAFYRYVRYNDDETYALLNQARKLAIKFGNVCDELWCNHIECAWRKTISPIERSFWRDHASHDLMDFHELENNDSNYGFYTLEPPVFNMF